MTGESADGPQYLMDLAGGSWLAETLFTAVEAEIFTLLDGGGGSLATVTQETGWAPDGVPRFLRVLETMGLITGDQRLFVNTPVARDYLVKGKEHYLGDLILWRKYLGSYWRGLRECLAAGGRVDYPAGEERAAYLERLTRYIGAMDAVAKIKAQQILAVCGDVLGGGEILDVGAGSGAMAAGFLTRFPGFSATLLDLPEVLDLTRGFMEERGLSGRVSYCSGNVLEPWSLPAGRFQLVIVSNLIHVYGEDEAAHILASAARCLAVDGLLLVHDFFPEHFAHAAAVYDLNMFLNTYNGRLFPSGWVQDKLRREDLVASALIPLPTDTALIVAARRKVQLEPFLQDAGC